MSWSVECVERSCEASRSEPEGAPDSSPQATVGTESIPGPVPTCRATSPVQKIEESDHQCLLSVVIIARNEEEYIENCIRSVLEAVAGLQAEVLLVDSASEDGTLAIAERFGIQTLSIPSEALVGAATGRFTGAQNCRGRYIQFVDGDMTLDPTWIRRALDYAEAADQSLAAVAGEIRQNPTANAAREYQRKNLARMTSTGEARELESLYGAFMIRAHVLREVGSFKVHLKALEEAELSDRIRAAGYRIILLPYLMCHHHVREGEHFVYALRRALLAGIAGGEVFRKSLGTSSFLFRLRQFKGSFVAAGFVLYGLIALISTFVFRSAWPGLSWCLLLVLLYSLLVIREKGRCRHALYFLIAFLSSWVFFFYGLFKSGRQPTGAV